MQSKLPKVYKVVVRNGEKKNRWLWGSNTYECLKQSAPLDSFLRFGRDSIDFQPVHKLVKLINHFRDQRNWVLKE
jgi:hypothetical protein